MAKRLYGAAMVVVMDTDSSSVSRGLPT